ncbi:MAG: D-glycero-alpha-D-manno-heptose-1,7-bisphosphate 7-phosphatase [Terrimicrobiaceae bacterium]
MKRAIFFDRDGILNRVVMRGSVVGSPRTMDEFQLLPEAGLLVHAAHESGFLAIVVTNQPDLARGLLSRETVDLMHAALRAAAPVDGIEVAEGGDDSDPRRKPNPGMLLDAAAKYGISLPDSWIVGDSPKDVEAGERAGVRTVLLETSYNSLIHGKADRNFSSPNQLVTFIKSLSS